MMTSDEKRRERHRRYNQSAKGQARNKKYERKHPERKIRWEQARDKLRPTSGW